jgi:hypothetical protein
MPVRFYNGLTLSWAYLKPNCCLEISTMCSKVLRQAEISRGFPQASVNSELVPKYTLHSTLLVQPSQS